MVSRFLPMVSAGVFMAVGCTEEPPAPPAGSSDVMFTNHVYKMAVRDSHDQPTGADTVAHLTYFGGKVIPDVHVTQVLYGAGIYLPELSSTGGVNLAKAYDQMVTSGAFDWLSEYTTSPARPIGRGSFGGSVQISPAASRSGSTVTDAAIQSELAAQIHAGTVPVPDDNQLYMMSFPSGTSIVAPDGSLSCVAGGFCAYHGTFKIDSQDVYYSVLPDLTTGACASGCGAGTAFQNQQFVASHELVASITNAEVGLASVTGAPFGWYDPDHGEIGDLCNGQQATFTGGDTTTYTVLQGFSNLHGGCIEASPAPGPACELNPPYGDQGRALVWRNADGAVELWRMAGETIVDQPIIGSAVPAWTIAGIGDFDHDGNSDLLWRNTDGTIELWLMNGVTIVSQPVVGSPGNDWKIEGIGDFNHDGDSDIVLRNADGRVQVWLMNGGVVMSRQDITSAGPEWKIEGVGDFDHDCNSDILWRSIDGWVELWLMDGVAIASRPVVSHATEDWAIAGVGDFDRDGNSDILWLNTDGWVELWLMNGGIAASQPIIGKATNDWMIQGIGDFDHDGHSDILWRNDLGVVKLWLMNDISVATEAVVGSAGNDWTIAGVGHL